MTIFWYMEYGPYSPQEIERIVLWLQTKGIGFEILRNDQDAKESLMNDGLNAVRLADLRTGVYLGQIFYVIPKDASPSIHREFSETFSRPEEQFASPEKFAHSEESDAGLTQSAAAHEQAQRSWAKWLAIALIISIVLGFILNTFY